MSEQRLIVGLGNPGSQYKETRHNIGFMVLEAFSRRADIVGKTEKKFNAIVGSGRHGKHKLILVEPLTFMNLSGQAVSKILNYYQLEPEHLLAVYDEAALPFGRIRIRPSGSDAGQKGMKSIITELGTSDFARLRVGIGSPPAKMAMPDFVPSRFDSEEQKDLSRIIEAAMDAIDSWLDQGTEATMTRFNGLDLLS